MDTSTEYIKMCKMAVEIQERAKSFADNGGRKYIWLPRQEQLQEMMEENYRIPDMCIELLKGFLYDNCMSDTWEKMWIQLVMQELYHKIWTGDEWVIH